MPGGVEYKSHDSITNDILSGLSKNAKKNSNYNGSMSRFTSGSITYAFVNCSNFSGKTFKAWGTDTYPCIDGSGFGKYTSGQSLDETGWGAYYPNGFFKAIFATAVCTRAGQFHFIGKSNFASNDNHSTNLGTYSVNQSMSFFYTPTQISFIATDHLIYFHTHSSDWQVSDYGFYWD